VLADAIAIKNQNPVDQSVSPNVDASVQIIYGNQNWFTSYRAFSPEYFDIKAVVHRPGPQHFRRTTRIVPRTFA